MAPRDPRDSPRRSAQNLAFLMGAVFVASMLATNAAIAWTIQTKNDSVSAKTTKELAHLSTASIAKAYYVFYNTTGSLVRVDITPQLNTSIIDVPNANGHPGLEGIQVDSVLLGSTGYGGANETDPSRPSHLEFILNQTSVGRFLEAPLTRVTYTFRTIASGQYTPNTVNATPRDYHATSSADFGLIVGFAQGDTSLVSHGGMTIVDGSSVGGNYTRKTGVEGISLIRADRDGKEFQEEYDNPVVLKVTGYKAGRNGNLGDSIRLSVRFETPDSAGAWSWYTGYAICFAVAGVAFIFLAALASRFYAFRNTFPFIGRQTPRAGPRRG